MDLRFLDFLARDCFESHAPPPRSRAIEESGAGVLYCFTSKRDTKREVERKAMNRATKAYVEAYVAAQRSKRHKARHDAEWNRWATRAALAERLGKPELAEAARRQALLHGESAVQWEYTRRAQAALAADLRLCALRDRSF